MPYANLYNEEIAKEVKKRNQKLIDHEKKQSETPSAEASAKHYKEHVSQKEKPKDDVVEMIKYLCEICKILMLHILNQRQNQKARKN